MYTGIVLKASGKALLAEFVGTGLLVLGVYMTTAAKTGSTVVLAALTLMLVVYLVGHISGGQVNPAITVGLLAIRKMKVTDAVAFVIVQFVGARAAVFLARRMIAGSVALPVVRGSVGLAEAVGAFVLAMAVAAVVSKKVSVGASGAVVGIGLFVGVSLAAMGSQGMINPAVAYAMGTLTGPYLWGPVAGSVVAFWLYRVMAR